MGIIYLCIGLNGRCYVGQHFTEELNTRKRGHLYSYYKFLRQKVIQELKAHQDPTYKIKPIKGNCTALLNAFAKYGPTSFKWSVLKRGIARKDLNYWEDHFIDEYDSLSPNGYNLKKNSADAEGFCYSEESRKRSSESSKIKTTVYLQKYRRRQDKLDGLPKHVTYFESGGIRGYRIVRHPNCKLRQFADKATPVEVLKKRTLDFLKKCETIPYKNILQSKAETGVPTGMSEQKPGRFLVQFRTKNIKYVKFFSQEPREKALWLATAWMNEKKKLLINKITDDPNMEDLIRKYEQLIVDIKPFRLPADIPHRLIIYHKQIVSRKFRD